MLGIRVNEGLCIRDHGLDHEGLTELVERGWVDAANGRVKLTQQGRHVANEVAVRMSLGQSRVPRGGLH